MAFKVVVAVLEVLRVFQVAMGEMGGGKVNISKKIGAILEKSRC